MNLRFLAGLGLGFAATVTLVLVRGALRNEGEQPDKMSLVGTQRLASIEQTLSDEREQARRLRSQLEAAQARVVALETLQTTRTRSGEEPPSKPKEPLDGRQAESPVGDQKPVDAAKFRAKMQIGQDLPGDAAAWMGLDDARRQYLNNLLRQEGAQMYGSMRALVAEDPSVQVPQSDGRSLFHALVGSTGFIRDLGKVFERLSSEPEIIAGKKTLYLEDILPPGSPYLRFHDSLTNARQETLRNARTALSEDQYTKFAALLGDGRCNFGGLSTDIMHPNVRARRTP